MNFAIIGVLLLVFIAFIVFVWKSAKHWRWYQIVGAVLLMTLAMIFPFPTAGVLKSRTAWHKFKVDSEKELQEVLEQNNILRNGDPNDASAGRSLIELRRELDKTGLEAGRHWFGLVSNGRNPQNIQLTEAQQQAPGIPGQPAEEAAAPGPTQPLIDNGMIVYGFAEALVNGAGDKPLPVFYLGEFFVSGATPTSVTLQPTSPLEKSQIDRIQNGQAVQWSVYELLPLDSHDVFIAEGSEADEENIFGRVDSNLVNGLLSNPKILPETKTAYSDDGKARTDVPPPVRWVKVEFIKKHTIIVDSPNQFSALEERFFDDSGRSVDSRLQRDDNGSVSFSKGEIITLKHEAAEKLIDDGVVELKNTYYVRQLNNYRALLRDLPLNIKRFDDRLKELEYDKTILDAAIAATDAIRVSEQADKEKLEQDRDQLRVERESIQKFATGLNTEYTSVKKELTNFYQTNVQLEKEIRRYHGVR